MIGILSLLFFNMSFTKHPSILTIINLAYLLKLNPDKKGGI